MNEKRKARNEKRWPRAIATLAILLSFSFFVFRFSFAQVTTEPAAPTTQPSQPAQPIAQIQKWFDDLASSEPQVRDDARTELLGLNKPDLDTLREVVRRSLPLAPSQSAVLHDIITHCYLASTKDPSIPLGFLGVMLDPPDNGVQENMELAKAGVYIFDCMKGYCGYRWLRPADVVTGIFAAGELIRMNERRDLQDFVRNTLPGSPLKLQVLRQGRVIEVTLRVDSRPKIADDPLQQAQIEEWKNKRRDEAEEYWNREFVPILGAMT